MKVENFNHVQFEDSYITGWDVGEHRIIINVYLILLERHTLFVLYEGKSEFACYRNGFIEIEGYGTSTGFPNMKQGQHWNEEPGEFDDFGEIESLELNEELSELRIETDEFLIEIKEIQTIKLVIEP